MEYNQSETRNPNPQEEGRNSEVAWLVAFAAVFIIAVGAAIYLVPKKVLPPTGVTPELVLDADAFDFEGNYQMKITGGDRTIYRSCQINRISTDTYQVYVVMEYGPRYYTFTVDDLGGITSEKLGTGVVKYKQNIKKTTIRFENGESICELSK